MMRKKTLRKIHDAEALDGIWELLDGVEWEPETLEAIAEILEETGRHVSAPGEKEEEEAER